MNSAMLPNPERRRTIERPFGWAPFRLVTSGLLARLSVAAKALYLALCLVADRRGLSYWSQRRLQALVGLDPAGLHQARQELMGHDLLAFDGRLYQLLSLPTAVRKSTAEAQLRSTVSRSGPIHVGTMLAPLMERQKAR
jgi:hypothetical protein